MKREVSRARFSQEDIRRCEKGGSSKIIIDRHVMPMSISGEGLDLLMEYRAFPISEVAASRYEELLADYKPQAIIDVGSGLGTSVLSACIITVSGIAPIEHVYSIEVSETKYNWMRQYLEYCGMSKLVTSISQDKFADLLTKISKGPLLIFMDCWPEPAFEYANIITHAYSTVDTTVVIDCSTVQDQSTEQLLLRLLGGQYQLRSSKVGDLLVTTLPKIRCIESA